MSDYKYFGGAVLGPATVRQNVEMTPYGTDYRRTEIHLGLENTRYVPFIPFVPASWARATWLADASFDDTAGGQINWGSRRTAGFLRGGLRFRLTPPGILVGDVRLGVGAASNELNFGKGIHPPKDYSLNIQGQATIGMIFCLNPDFCLGPVVGGSFDLAALSTGRDYTSSHGPFIGFRIEGQVNPAPDGDPSSCRKEREKVEGECVERTKVIYEEKEKWRTRYERVAEGQRAAKAGEPPHVPKPAIETTPSSDKRPETSPPVPEKTVPGHVKSPTAVSQDPREIEYLWLRELPKGLHFQNDKADLLPLPQQFPLCRDKCGDGNPVLNLVIFGARRWAKSVVQLSPEGSPDYKMNIFVQGLANDTGDSGHNFELANQRRGNVIGYLSGSGGKKYDRRDYEGQKVPPLKAGEKLGSERGRMRLGDIVSITAVETQPDPMEDIVVILTGKKRADLSPSEWDQIKYKVKGEEWRRAAITYKIFKRDGEAYREITMDQYIQEQIFGTPRKGAK